MKITPYVLLKKARFFLKKIKRYLVMNMRKWPMLEMVE